MPYIKRDESGHIVAVSQSAESGFDEELSSDHPDVSAFLSNLQSANATLDATDQDFVRVVEDLVQVLVEKGVILFTDLPDSAQEKMLFRQQLRSKLSGNLDLIGDD
ncbi:MAG: hypothetical protein ABJ013_09690 [Halioglobus sp.]